MSMMSMPGIMIVSGVFANLYILKRHDELLIES